MNNTKIIDFIGKSGQSALSMVKIAFGFRRFSKRKPLRPDDSVVILGNGPSLRQTIDEYGDILVNKNTMAVNFAANTSMFGTLKPNYYILADPHFFIHADSDVNVRMLWQNISNADWAINLFVPYKRLKEVRSILGNNANVIVNGFSMTPCEGFDWFCNAVYSLGIGTPRPRNVLIPALMTSLRLGFGEIFVAGADHSWTKTLDVDDNNRVVSVQPHFYEDNEHEKKRIVTEYHNYPLHTILQSLYIAFRSYYTIREYANSLGAKVINITPGSFIDAFERGRLK